MSSVLYSTLTTAARRRHSLAPCRYASARLALLPYICLIFLQPYRSSAPLARSLSLCVRSLLLISALSDTRRLALFGRSSAPLASRPCRYASARLALILRRRSLLARSLSLCVRSLMRPLVGATSRRSLSLCSLSRLIAAYMRRPLATRSRPLTRYASRPLVGATRLLRSLIFTYSSLLSLSRPLATRSLALVSASVLLVTMLHMQYTLRIFTISSDIAAYAAYCGIYALSGILRHYKDCLLYTSPSPRDQRGSRMPSSA